MSHHYNGAGMWTALATSVGFTVSSITLSESTKSALANLVITIIVGAVAGWLKTRKERIARRNLKKRKKPTHATQP